MNGARNITAGFLAAQAAALSGQITAKSGQTGGRLWQLTIANAGPAPAFNTQIHALMLVQTFGAACVPGRVSPASYPITLGSISSAQAASGGVLLDFSGCPANARFTATFIYSANGGNSAGASVLYNQLPQQEPLMTIKSIFYLLTLSVAMQASTISLTPQDLFGLPGDTVGWGFRIENPSQD